jgi:hypothetical protein
MQGNPRQFDIGWSYIVNAHISATVQLLIPTPESGRQICVEKVQFRVEGGVGAAYSLIVRRNAVLYAIFQRTSVDSKGYTYRGPIALESRTGDELLFFFLKNTTPTSITVTAEWVRR